MRKLFYLASMLSLLGSQTPSYAGTPTSWNLDDFRGHRTASVQSLDGKWRLEMTCVYRADGNSMSASIARIDQRYSRDQQNALVDGARVSFVLGYGTYTVGTRDGEIRPRPGFDEDNLVRVAAQIASRHESEFTVTSEMSGISTTFSTAGADSALNPDGAPFFQGCTGRERGSPLSFIPDYRVDDGCARRSGTRSEFNACVRREQAAYDALDTMSEVPRSDINLCLLRVSPATVHFQGSYPFILNCLSRLLHERANPEPIQRFRP